MNRWKVAQHIHYRTWLAYPAYYDSGQPHNDMDDDKPRTPRARAFRTWREAQYYADRQARTREYVLPRPDKDGDIATTDEQIAWENTEFESNVVSVAWIEEPGTIGLSIGNSDHYMTTDGAHSIGLALLALAEQEGHA